MNGQAVAKNEVEPRSETRRESEALNDTTSHLYEMLQILHKKLEPVLRPETPKKSDDKPSEANYTQFGKFLNEQACRTRLSVLFVADIIDRLEL